MAFKDYKKSGEDLKRAIQDTTQAINKNKFEKDPDEWYPSVDKSGSGYAIWRWLAGPESYGKNFIHYFAHNFQNDVTGEWYIENSLTTFENPDPVSEFNRKLWNKSKDEKDPAKAQARDQKRNLVYRSNILVLADPQYPENNGQIKKLKYGTSLFGFIQNAQTPQELPGIETPEGFNPFNPFSGANFRCVIYKKDGYRKYDKSFFEARGPYASEERMEEIYNEINNNPKWSLEQYLDPSKFKSYDALKARLDKVLGFDFTKDGVNQSRNDNPRPAAVPQRSSVPVSKTETPRNDVPQTESNFQSDEDFFAKLSEED